MAREHKQSTFGRNLVCETSGPHKRRAKGDVPGYQYFKIRSSVYDKDGKEIPSSVKNQELKTDNEAAALEHGFATASKWAQFH